MRKNFIQRDHNAPDAISTKTSARWMKFLGFNPKLQTKGYYTDGHNRADVTEYGDISPYYGGI